jgi:hypothetical protein
MLEAFECLLNLLMIIEYVGCLQNLLLFSLPLFVADFSQKLTPEIQCGENSLTNST